MSSYYYKRYLNNLITDNIDLEMINFDNRMCKEWFIGQMGKAFIILGNKREVKGKWEPISHDYATAFGTDTCPHPESHSWLSLFERYQLFKRQSVEYIKGFWSPDINDLMDEIVENFTWHEKLDDWFKLPISFLANNGVQYIQNIDRCNKGSFTGFKVKHESGFSLGYRELFSIPKFAEVYCETDEEEPLHLSDVPIAIVNGKSTRFYTIMMCKQLPAEMFR